MPKSVSLGELERLILLRCTAETTLTVTLSKSSWRVKSTGLLPLVRSIRPWNVWKGRVSCLREWPGITRTRRQAQAPVHGQRVRRSRHQLCTGRMAETRARPGRNSRNGMIASYREVDYSTAWTNWPEHSRYTRRRYARYSPARLCIEAFCYAVLTFLAQYSIQVFAAPQDRWLQIAGRILAFASGGFGILSAIAFLLIAGPGFADLVGTIGEPRTLPTSETLPSQSAPQVGEEPERGGPQPPITPSLLLELVLPAA